MEWIYQTILSTLLSSVITVGFLSVLINRLQVSLSLKNNGIKKIHAKGRNVKSLEKAMSKSKCIKVLGLAAHGFIFNNRKTLTNHVSRGGRLEFLLATPNTEFVIEASLMENRNEKSISSSINDAIILIEGIKANATQIADRNGSNCGEVEVKHYNTEIRNQMIICIDYNENASAWMSVLTPPEPAIECIMIEYSDSVRCVSYYDTIWNRH